jgi:glycosyltransferase involved in cell wall biosynthesis
MMTTHTQLSIIVPCYNEEQRIAHTISKLLPAVDKLNISYEIILVNDGSVDDTHTIIKDLAHNNSNITVLSYHNNRGK